ncbi:eukaryotic translation initiation factor 2-alpha kinase [Dimargaris cristalligena]|nr:eukaryotic translation initiation factor 2-alpha kinase [Dimargaris cristalligena]
MDDLSAGELQELQANELAALEAIYMQDFERVESASVWKITAPAPEFRLTLRPLETDLQAQVHAVLHVRFPKLYPRKPPIVALDSHQGLEPAQVHDLQGQIADAVIASTGGEMVFELATLVQEFITAHHAPLKPPSAGAIVPSESAHHAMVQRAERIRQAELAREAEERQRLLLQENEARFHADRELEQRILQDLDLKRALIWKERQKQQRFVAPPALAPNPTTLAETGPLASLSHYLALTTTDGQSPGGWRPLIVLSTPAHLGPDDSLASSFRTLVCSPALPFAGIGSLCPAIALADPTIPDDSTSFNSTRPSTFSPTTAKLGPAASRRPSPGANSHTTFPLTLHLIEFSNPHYQAGVGLKRVLKLHKEINRLKILQHESIVAVLDCQLMDDSAAGSPRSPPQWPLDGMNQQPLHGPHTMSRRGYSTPQATSVLRSVPTAVGPGLATTGLSLCVLMESIGNGITLSHALQSCGPLVWSQAKYYVKQLLYSLVYIHSNGFVHKVLGHNERGERLAKFLLISYHRTAIDMNLQFPFALGGTASVSQSATGAPTYNKKCDVFDLGLVVLDMVLGLETRSDNTPVEDRYQRLVPLVPPSMAQVVHKMLTRDRRQQPTALELLADPFFRETTEENVERIPALYLLGGSSGQWTMETGSASGTHTPDSRLGKPDTVGLELPSPSRALGILTSPMMAPTSATAITSLAKLPQPGLPLGRPMVGDTRRPPTARRRSSSSSYNKHTLSRYRSDFEEIEFLGKGGYGEVVKARNKLDDRFYAVKKIKLDPRDVETNRKILREVTTLSRLHHEYVVRYYTTWFEDANGEWGNHASSSEDGLGGSSDSRLFESGSDFESDASSASDILTNSAFHNDLLFVDESHSKSIPGIHFGRIGGEYNRSTRSRRRVHSASSSVAAIATNASAAPSQKSRPPALESRMPAPPMSLTSRLGLMMSSFPEDLSEIPTAPSSSDESSSSSSVDGMDLAIGHKGHSDSEAPSKPMSRLPSSKFFSVSPGRLTFDPLALASGTSSSASTPVSPAPTVSTTPSLFSADILSERRSSGTGRASASPRMIQRGARGTLRSAKDAGNMASPARNSMRRDYRILYIQMEYCEKNTLRDAIDLGLSLDECWRLFRQILEGLVYIHAQGMIHRDLKPSNVFLDANGDVKIGDFGLATSNQTQINASTIRSRHASLDRDPEDSMTSDIGTTLYVAPEVTQSLKGGGSRYNQKVDMYSLGIIFFEMCYPLQTGMERVKVLHDLRRAEVVFPSEFPDHHLANQRRIIEWLLKHNPRDRPTSLELFQSDYLPPRMEDDYIQECVRTIANPNTPYYNRLMSALFDQFPERPKDFTYDFYSDVADLEHTNSVYYDRVHDYLSRIFRRHGAVEVCTPLLMPRLDIYDQFQKPVHVMDPTGTLVQLPYDLTLPFARYVARNKIQELKRFSFDKIYKENPVGGQPRQVYEVDFDSVWAHPNNPIGGAEVFKIVDEIFEDLPIYAHKPLIFLVNHSCLLDTIFDHLRIPEDLRRPCCSFLRQLGVSLSMVQVRQNLMAHLDLPRHVLDTLERFNIQGDLATLRKLFQTLIPADATRLTARWQDALEDLGRLELALNPFTLKHRWTYCPLLVNNYYYYKDHFFFQFVVDNKKREVLATGGRYDKLVQFFQAPTTLSKGGGGSGSGGAALKDRSAPRRLAVAAAGVNIAIQKVIFEIANYQSTFLRSLSRSKHDTVPPSFGLWARKRCDVAIASFGRTLLAERITIAQELWQHNIRTDFLYDDSEETTAEMVTRICVNQGINWIVNIKLKPADAFTNGLGGGVSGDDRSGLSRSTNRRETRRQMRSGRSSPTSGNDHPGRIGIGGLHKPHSGGKIPTSSDAVAAGMASAALRPSRSIDGLRPSGLAPTDMILKVRNLIRHTEEEVARADLPSYLSAEINEQHRHDLYLHDSRLKKHQATTYEFSDLGSGPRYDLLAAKYATLMVGGGGSGVLGSGGGVGGSSGMSGGGSGSIGGSGGGAGGLTGSGGASGGMDGHHTGGVPVALLDASLLDVEVVPGHSTGGGGSRGRMKDRQKQLIAERAASCVRDRSIHPGKPGMAIPVLAVDLSEVVLRKLVWCNLLQEDGLKRALEVCSAHQKDYVRHLVHVITQQHKTHPHCFFLWLYSYRDDFAAMFQFT